MKNLLMLLVAVLGTGTMVNALPIVVKVGPVKEIKATPVKEVKATKHSKNKSAKKVTAAKDEARKVATVKVKK